MDSEMKILSYFTCEYEYYTLPPNSIAGSPIMGILGHCCRNDVFSKPNQ